MTCCAPPVKGVVDRKISLFLFQIVKKLVSKWEKLWFDSKVKSIRYHSLVLFIYLFSPIMLFTAFNNQQKHILYTYKKETMYFWIGPFF